MEFTEREKEILYRALGLLLQKGKKLTMKEFSEIDNMRDQFYTGTEMPTY